MLCLQHLLSWLRHAGPLWLQSAPWTADDQLVSECTSVDQLSNIAASALLQSMAHYFSHRGVPFGTCSPEG